MNYFINEETLTQEEDSGKKLVKTEEMQAKNGKCFL